MYVHVRVCTCMYVYVRVCMCMYVYVCVCMCMYVYVCVCMYVYVCVCMCMYVYVCMYVCMYVCIYVCMYVCMYVHTHTHLHACVWCEKRSESSVRACECLLVQIHGRHKTILGNGTDQLVPEYSCECDLCWCCWCCCCCCCCSFFCLGILLRTCTRSCICFGAPETTGAGLVYDMAHILTSLYVQGLGARRSLHTPPYIFEAALMVPQRYATTGAYCMYMHTLRQLHICSCDCMYVQQCSFCCRN